MELTRSLSAIERQEIERRIAALEAHLAARDDYLVERSVTGLLLSFPSGRASGDEAGMVISAYVHVLSDLPPWAVDGAARQWMRGEVAGANPAFPPSTAEIHRVAKAVTLASQQEAQSLRRLLTAEVRSSTPMLRSREREAEHKAMMERVMARKNLEAKCEELGIPASAIDELPGASTAEDRGGWQKLNPPA